MLDQDKAMAAALESAAAAMAFHSRDWSLDHRDAWLYGIIIGWDDALDEVAAKHGWSNEERDRLTALHEALHADA